jgi:hypothetical protein
MFYDPWKEQIGEPLNLVFFDKNQRNFLKLLSDAAYYLCLSGTGLALREDYYDHARPEIIGVLSVSTSPPKHLKKGHLIPLDSRFVFDRNNGLYVVNSQAYFDLDERVKVVDHEKNRLIEFCVTRSL